MTPAEWTRQLERRRAALPAGTTVLRWSDEDLPGVTVDVLGPVGVLSLYREASGDEELALAQMLQAAGGLDAVYLKRRPREARREANEAATEVAPPLPLVGMPVERLVALEAGLSFEFRPGNGLSVGLYLDARDARSWVREHAQGRTVLNLFAYTCGFGVAAWAGGATRAVNVDASRKVLDWGEANLRLNGRVPERRDFIAGDAFDWLQRFARKQERFDLVVLDPPGFATTKESRFSAQRDYHRLVSAAAAVTAPGGSILALCNVEAMSWADLEGHLARGAGPGRVEQRFGASAIDFRQPSTLKCAVVRPSR